MQESGLRPDQIQQVQGFADQRLRTPDRPLEASNRRVSIIVQYMTRDIGPGDEDPDTAGAAGEESTQHKND